MTKLYLLYLPKNTIKSEPFHDLNFLSTHPVHKYFIIFLNFVVVEVPPWFASLSFFQILFIALSPRISKEKGHRNKTSQTFSNTLTSCNVKVFLANYFLNSHTVHQSFTAISKIKLKICLIKHNTFNIFPWCTFKGICYRVKGKEANLNLQKCALGINL